MSDKCPNCGVDHSLHCDSHGSPRVFCLPSDVINHRDRQLAQAKAENERLRNALMLYEDICRQVDAFLRNWQPDQIGPMKSQFGKMLHELVETREAAEAAKVKA